MKTRFFKRISTIGRTIKLSLAMIIPILFIGSFTVLLNGFPIQAYQDFLDYFLGGALRSIILIIQTTTVGTLAVYLTISLNLCYLNQTEEGQRMVSRFSSILASLTGFFILVGFFSGEPEVFFLAEKVFLVRFLQVS